MKARPPRIDIAAPEAAAASDTNDTNSDPQLLLKLSHSLRYQLSQPPRQQPAQLDGAAHFPGTLSHSAYPRPSSPQSQVAARDQTTPHTQHPSPPHQPLQTPSQQQQLPPINGPGTRSGPYSGFASKAWLQGEFRQDLDELRRHVDEYVSKREQRAFDVERTALKAEIAYLRKRLEESDARAAKLQSLLPDEDGEFRSLRAELEELEREADHFCDLYEREARATSAALEGFRHALADVTDIEAEFTRIRQLIDTLPKAAAPPPQPATQPGAQHTRAGFLGAPPRGPQTNGARRLAGGAHPAGVPGSPADQAAPRACCSCFPVRRR